MRSVNKGSEVWDQIEVFAVKKLNEIVGQTKSSEEKPPDYYIALHKAVSQKLRTYSVTGAGLQAALAAAVTGDVVILPACTIGGDQTLPAGVTLVGVSRDNCILTGQVTLGNGSRLQNLMVSRTTGADVKAVVGPASGTAYVIKCRLSVVLSSGTGWVVFTSGGYMKLLYSELICTSAGVAIEPFGGYYTGPTTFDFADGAQGWVFVDGWQGNGRSSSLGGHLSTWAEGGGSDTYWYRKTPGLIAKTGATMRADRGTLQAATIYYGGIGIYYKAGGSTGVNGTQLAAETITATVPVGSNNFEVEEIRVLNYPIYPADGHCDWDNVVLSGFDSTIPLVYVHGCVGAMGHGIPLESDRAVYDAEKYPLMHSNDTDERQTSIHHTLGVTATQAAAGNHDHIHAIHDNVSGEIAAITEQTTPVDADVTIIEESAAGNEKRKLRWANIKATLKTYFDALYAVTAKGVTNGDTHDHSGGDGAQINHTTLSSIGTNTHAQVDTFIASKAAASGLASLNASSLVVQNPANATATPTASKIPIADASGKLNRVWLGSNWADFTCTLSGSGGTAGTYAEDLAYARYTIIGGICHVVVRKRITNLGSWSGDVRINYPVAKPAGIGGVLGGGHVFASGAAITAPKGVAAVLTGAYCQFYKTILAYLQWSDLAVNDHVFINLTYEV